ncbi:paraquat-inducible protein A [Oleiharenicola lentus]|uniref:paraquat-inducible protein A n=1 Tax=Oleiharenicola lentus TaxID=2508720 RepID=UPI003F663BB6
MSRTLHCHACTLALTNVASEVETQICPRCSSTLHYRQPHSLARSSAFAVAGLIMLVPANILPVLSIELLGKARTDTIFSGVVSLFRDGLWGIALIVFAASILVPLLKLVSLGILIHAVHTKSIKRRRGLTKLYAFVKFIGRWSMLDVFLVAFLAGAVQFGSIASVRPEPGVIAFAAAVVLTIFATETFDSRLLWDIDEISTPDEQTKAPTP